MFPLMSRSLNDEPPVSGPALREPADNATIGTNVSDDATRVPLCVDLDGTLLRTDTLLESILQLVRHAPVNALRVIAWRLRGKAALKAEVARRVELDPASL